MAVIYLKHDVHGTKVACTDREASMDKEHGWFEYDPEEDREQADDNEPEVELAHAGFHNVLGAKRGRKPKGV